jgi:hypothetical protein
MDIKSLKSPFLAGFVVTFSDLFYFYTSLAYSTDLPSVAVEQIIIRNTFASGEVTLLHL